MKKVSDVEQDIYTKLDSSVDHDPSPELAAGYAMRIGGEMAKATQPRSRDREHGKLWASDLGETCNRKTYYKFNDQDKAIPLMGHTKFKFLYGNILEEAALYLAEEAGHTVEYAQERVEYDFDGEWKVSGRIDAVVDGTLIDVKSTSSFGYKKYSKEGITSANDAFGYLYQLGYYHHHNDFDIKNDEAGFLWIDKQNGHLLYNNATYHLPTKQDLDMRLNTIANTLRQRGAPARTISDVPEGKSGNRKLDIKCSYCDFRKHCWRDANGGKGLRTFLYNYGPQHLTEVKREPRVPEAYDA